MPAETVEQRVARGAGWLDAVYPEWWTKIDLGTLDIVDSCRCVLGQVVGRVNGQPGYRFVLHGIMPFLNGVEWMADRGFAGRDGDFAALDEAWVAECKRRWERGL